MPNNLVLETDKARDILPAIAQRQFQREMGIRLGISRYEEEELLDDTVSCRHSRNDLK